MFGSVRVRLATATGDADATAIARVSAHAERRIRACAGRALPAFDVFEKVVRNVGRDEVGKRVGRIDRW
jgi:hypothetical protein